MKHLTLIRHAKSSWDQSALPDHDRPLNARGQEAAPLIGSALAKNGFQPETLISSTAVRAITTARIIAEKIGFDPDAIVEDPDIYMASEGELIGVINRIDENINHAVLIGHNPGFENVTNALLRADSVERMPTCAVADLQLDVEHWGDAGENCASLLKHLYPRMFS